MAERDLLARARETAAHLESERYRGYDPYDALESPLFRRGPLRRWRTARWGAQQVVKRLPLNLRPVLGIRKGYNPVTLALALQGYAHLHQTNTGEAGEYRSRARFCVDELTRLRSAGYSGACWGYDFDWESRYASIPAQTPTIVATGFVTNALFMAYRTFEFEDCLELCASSCDFVANDLPRTEEPDGSFCWSYSPRGRDVVLNATMKGARLMAQVYSVTGEPRLRELAAATGAFVAARQRPDGSWPYAEGDSRGWSDNFHTAYVIDCLQALEKLAGETRFAPVTETGYRFYLEHFFTDAMVPKYYPDKLYPIDATACAQAIITLAKFGDVERALRVASWAVANLGLPGGAFAYQITRAYRNRIPYVRWSTAWMFAALAGVVEASSS